MTEKKKAQPKRTSLPQHRTKHLHNQQRQKKIDNYAHPKKANSLNLLLSSSSIPCISIKILPRLCIVGLNGIALTLGLAAGTGVCDLRPARGPKSEGDIGGDAVVVVGEVVVVVEGGKEEGNFEGEGGKRDESKADGGER